MRSRLSASGIFGRLPDCPSFNAALILFTLYKIFDVNTGSDYFGRIEFAGLDKLLDFGDRHPASRRHHRIKITSRLTIHQIAVPVALPCFYQGEVGCEGMFQQISAALKLTH